MRFHPTKPGRRGFTLIELLVVIAIIAILIGLLVPAVQKVREAAARTQCQNNLKQLGLAMHMYQDTYKKLPAGWVVSTAAQPSPGWTWSLVILPYIEQAPLYNNIAPDVTTPGGPAGGTTSALLQTSVPVYQCPSDGTGPIVTATYNGGIAWGKNNYVCNRWVLGPDDHNPPRPTRMAVQTILDGSSNTILIGERDQTINVGAVEFVRASTTASFEGRIGRGLSPQPPAGTVWNTGQDQRLAYSSLHTGGCNFAFADGSVHFIGSSMDCDPNDNWTNFATGAQPADWINYTGQRLQNPNDGLPVTIPNL
jgi:prepilin-type N-terminal cleavage/methylation domain-containing protein/prepilin-type processing-associated H-X9-DG protein